MNKLETPLTIGFGIVTEGPFRFHGTARQSTLGEVLRHQFLKAETMLNSPQDQDWQRRSLGSRYGVGPQRLGPFTKNALEPGSC